MSLLFLLLAWKGTVCLVCVRPSVCLFLCLSIATVVRCKGLMKPLRYYISEALTALTLEVCACVRKHVCVCVFVRVQLPQLRLRSLHGTVSGERGQCFRVDMSTTSFRCTKGMLCPWEGFSPHLLLYTQAYIMEKKLFCYESHFK